MEDLLTKIFLSKIFDGYKDNVSVRCILDVVWGLVGVVRIETLKA